MPLDTTPFTLTADELLPEKLNFGIELNLQSSQARSM